MPTQAQTLTEQEIHAIVCVCILAAFADGAQAEVERGQIERIVNGFSQEKLDLASAYQQVLAGKLDLAQVTAQLQTASARALAYEMAVCVCNADGVLQEPEKQFLLELSKALQLPPPSASQHAATAEALTAPPVITPQVAPLSMGNALEDEIDHQILNTAILTGALEMMPHTLATMAIVPIQIRMVYQIGKRYGFELDRGHIKDLLATVGVGLTSQVFEGFTRRLVGGLARGVAGRFLGGLAAEATGSAFAFASTYALGQVAKKYYSGGRTLSTDQLKQVFTSMLSEARSVQGRYTGDITRKAQQVNVSELLPLVRSQ